MILITTCGQFILKLNTLTKLKYIMKPKLIIFILKINA